MDITSTSADTASTSIFATAETIGTAATYMMCVFAIFGLIMIGIGCVRILDARRERRETPPTRHIKFSEGIWRIGVGAGLILNAGFALTL